MLYRWFDLAVRWSDDAGSDHERRCYLHEEVPSWYSKDDTRGR
jgi:hypothetical protein